MITGYPTIRTAMQALHLGAVDYVAKPFRRKELLGPVNRALRREADGRPKDSVPPVGDNGEIPERLSMHPGIGAVFYLRDHSWAEFQQDGSVRIGVEASFLGNVGELAEIALPDEADLIEQGFVGIRLTTKAGEEHGVFMPLSGQVIAANASAAVEPSAIEPSDWLLQIIPTALDSEKDFLKRRRSSL